MRASYHPKLLQLRGFVAEHDGYVGQYGARHRRTVEFDDVSRFTIIDELVGVPTDRSVTVSFLIDPSCQSTVKPDRSGVLISRCNLQLVRISSAGPLKARVVRGDKATGLGWLSPSYCVRVPTDQILFEGHLRDRRSTITIDLL
ncbi:heparinase II/III domain-containing protein [Bradyrhizobium diazoefficiens]